MNSFIHPESEVLNLPAPFLQFSGPRQPPEPSMCHCTASLSLPGGPFYRPRTRSGTAFCLVTRLTPRRMKPTPYPGAVEQRRIQPFPKGGGAKRVPKPENLFKNCIWACRTEEQKGGVQNLVLAPRMPISARLATPGSTFVVHISNQNRFGIALHLICPWKCSCAFMDSVAARRFD